MSACHAGNLRDSSTMIHQLFLPRDENQQRPDGGKRPVRITVCWPRSRAGEHTVTSPSSGAPLSLILSERQRHYQYGRPASNMASVTHVMQVQHEHAMNATPRAWLWQFMAGAARLFRQPSNASVHSLYSCNNVGPTVMLM